MNAPNRRAFLCASAGGLASVLLPDHGCAAAPPEVAPAPRAVETLPTNLKPQDTLFLTWQRDPTTTATVQWIGPAQAVPEHVRVASHTGSGGWKEQAVVQKDFGKTHLKVHRCEFTGLTPGTEYVLQVGGSSQLCRFRTMPAKATNTFTFVSGGDAGTNSHAVANNILAAKQEPYFVLLGGDLAYDNGTSAKTAIQFYMNYSRTMIDPKGRLIPLVSTLGNHEVRGSYKGRRSDATHYLPLFDGLYSETTYGALDFGDYLSLVLLDSGHVSPIEGAQTDWLEKTLKERQDRPHLFAANHVPAYPSFRAPAASPTLAAIVNPFLKEKLGGTGAENRKHWCPLFERHGVDAVLEHHDHTFKRTHPMLDGLRNRYGVPYLGDGSWGRLRAPAPPEKRPYLAAVAEAYHMTVHKLEGDHRYHVALEENGRIADVFGTTGKRPAKRG